MFPAVLVMQMMNTPNYIVNVQELDKILWTQKGKRVITLTKFRNNPSFCTAGVWSHLQITIFRYCPHIWKLFVLDFLCFFLRYFTYTVHLTDTAAVWEEHFNCFFSYIDNSHATLLIVQYLLYPDKSKFYKNSVTTLDLLEVCYSVTICREPFHSPLLVVSYFLHILLCSGGFWASALRQWVFNSQPIKVFWLWGWGNVVTTLHASISLLCSPSVLWMSVHLFLQGHIVKAEWPTGNAAPCYKGV